MRLEANAERRSRSGINSSSINDFAIEHIQASLSTLQAATLTPGFNRRFAALDFWQHDARQDVSPRDVWR